jgi:hypothetical protein
MGGDLEQNIQDLNSYLAQENTFLAKNIKLEKDITNIQGEIDRSTMNYDRYAKTLICLFIISALLFIYNADFDIMYPFRAFVNFLSNVAERQIGFISIIAICLFCILYFSNMSFSKLVTSTTMTGLLYYTLLNVFGIDLMGMPLIVIFFFMFYIFEF